MYPLEVSWIALIVFIPLAGAFLNAVLGRRMGKGFVRLVGVGAPLLSFVLSLACFFGLYAADYGIPSWVPVAGEGDVVALKAAEPEPVAAAQRVLERDPRFDRKYWLMFNEADGKVLRIRNTQAAVLSGNELTHDDRALKDLQARFGAQLTVGAAGAVAPRAYAVDLGSWIKLAGLDIRFAFHVDRLAIILMLVITGVGTLIHLYSTGYMGHEPAGTFARYFTYLNLFVGAMLVLVMGANMLLLFVGWEGVGLCSYLLIGFEYEDPDKAACGTKAFVVNRIGDLGFVLGTLTLLWWSQKAGDATLAFSDLNLMAENVPATVLGAACALLFIGATGKSAQLPLQLWLPDAMAGPTPVSALIHAATMVTAGIYMISRLLPVFAAGVVFGVPVLSLVAVVGVLTALFAGTAALGQDDIKKVLAYSTISQLGYMFVGVGALAMGAAIFHLVTHAFFKALLFLAAGSVIHACHTNDMKQMGGLRRYMPTTYWTMVVGAAALAGFPLLSGFFSKDMILFEALARWKTENASGAWLLVYLTGAFTGLVTAVYSTRLIAMTFHGEYRGSGTPHESPSVMTGPLVALAVLTVLGALLGLPEVFPGVPAVLLPKYFLEPILPGTVLTTMAAGRPGLEALHHLEWVGLIAGAAVAIVGIVAAWSVWGGKAPSQVAWETRQTGPMAGLRRTLAAAWYYDLGLNKRFIQPATKYLADILWHHVDDTAIDRGIVDGTGRVAVQLSLFSRALQTGHLARYAGYLVVGVVAVAVLSQAGVLDFLGR